MAIGNQTTTTGYSGGDYLSEESVLRSHPLYPARKQRCCNVTGDGFTIIAVCFFIFTVALTVALIIQMHYGSPEVTPHGAVSTNKDLCSHVGITVMGEGGSAVDVAIASVLCMAVMHPHSVGPGGSGVMLVHDHKMNATVVVDFMSGVPHSLNRQQLSATAGGAIGVPGFFRGLEYAHRKFGKLPWRSLFQPSIDIARQGFAVSDHLVDALDSLNIAQVEGITPFEQTFFPNGVKLHSGDVMRREAFADLLEVVGLYGADSFYALNFGAEEFEALRESGSAIKVKDFEDYEALEQPCIHAMVHNMSFFTAPAPFGGPQLLAAMQLLANTNFTTQLSQSFLYHAFVEAIRKSYQGFLELADAEAGTQLNLTAALLAATRHQAIDARVTPAAPQVFHLPQQAGTAISVIDTFDQYVTLVAGLGSYFGSQVMTKSGILFNNHLANLPPTSHPPPTAGHARPLTTYTPVIITDAQQVCGARVVLSSPEVGAVVQVAGQLLLQHLELTQAIEQPRVTVKPGDDVIYVEDYGSAARLPGTVRNDLRGMNHTYSILGLPYTSVNGVAKTRDKVLSLSDVRGGGIAHRIEPIVPSSNITAQP